MGHLLDMMSQFDEALEWDVDDGFDDEVGSEAAPSDLG